MRRDALLLLLLCLVLCGCGGAASQHASHQILVIGGADYDEPAGALAVVRDDGTGFRRLPGGSALEAQWSPDGRRIALISADNFTPQSSIWVMNADGRNQRRLVPDFHGYTHLLEWAPDGRRILYGRGSHVWSVRADGRDDRRLAAGGDAAWSPDGRSIAFAGDGIYVMHADGSNLMRLAARGISPAWTPDGKTIVFLRGPVGEASPVYTVAAVGGRPRLLAWVLSDYIADVSPDGRSVLLGPGVSGLTVVSSHDGTFRRLTRDRDDYRGEWSSDGRRIAFIHGPDLWLIDADGGNAKRVRKAPSGMFFSLATWRP